MGTRGTYAKPALQRQTMKQVGGLTVTVDKTRVAARHSRSLLILSLSLSWQVASAASKHQDADKMLMVRRAKKNLEKGCNSTLRQPASNGSNEEETSRDAGADTGSTLVPLQISPGTTGQRVLQICITSQ
jgi:hypothetical protein